MDTVVDHHPRRALGAAGALIAILWAGAAAADPPPSAPAAPPPSAKAPAAGGDAGAITHYEDSVTPTFDNGALQRSLAVVTGSVGFAGLVVGSVFGGLAVSRWNKVKKAASTCHTPATFDGCPEQLEIDQMAASSYATVSNYSLITGTVFIAGAIAMWYLAPRRPKPVALQILPAVGPGGAGGVLTGAF